MFNQANMLAIQSIEQEILRSIIQIATNSTVLYDVGYIGTWNNITFNISCFEL